jgi:hypothetical protein
MMSSEKVVFGLKVANLASRRWRGIDGPLIADFLRTQRGSKIVMDRNCRQSLPFRARCRTIELWSILLMALNFSA